MGIQKKLFNLLIILIHLVNLIYSLGVSSMILTQDLASDRY
jgi:hypothetical protein